MESLEWTGREDGQALLDSDTAEPIHGVRVARRSVPFLFWWIWTLEYLGEDEPLGLSEGFDRVIGGRCPK